VSRRVALVAVAAAIAGTAAGAVAHEVGALTAVEQRSVDARFDLRGVRQPPADLVIVALDTDSYRQLPRPPLPRGVWVELTERLQEAGARVIAYDFAFERPSEDARADRRLVRALDRSHRAVVSLTAIGADGARAPLAGRVPLEDVDVTSGVTLLARDGDGAIRRFPAELGGVPTFAVSTAERFRARAILPPASGAYIDFPGPAGTIPAISLTDVLDGRFDPGAVRNRIVVVGPTAPVMQDLHRTSVDTAMSGAEIHAAATATALAGFPLRTAPGGLAMLALLGAIVPLLVVVLRAARASWAIALIGLGTAAAWSLAAQIAFNQGAVLPYADGLLTIAVATAVMWAGATVADRRERRRLRRLFAEASSTARRSCISTVGSPSS
jgi:CHASE2 domain-containing sensor protein